MDYQAMWERLKQEISYLICNEVKSIDPHIVSGYMGFLEEIEEHKDEQDNKGN